MHARCKRALYEGLQFVRHPLPVLHRFNASFCLGAFDVPVHLSGPGPFLEEPKASKVPKVPKVPKVRVVPRLGGDRWYMYAIRRGFGFSTGRTGGAASGSTQTGNILSTSTSSTRDGIDSGATTVTGRSVVYV